MTVTPEAGEHYEKLEQDSGPCKKGPCVLCWKRMPETAESENKSRRSCWLKLNETIAVVLRAQVCAGSSTVHRCLCELC